MNTVTRIEDTYLKPEASQAHENMHPGQVNYKDYDDNAALKLANETFDYGFTQATEARQLRNRSGGGFDPEWNPARHDRAIRERVGQVDSEWATRMDNTRANLKAELSRVEGELERAANLKPNAAWYGAIVGTLQSKDAGERQDILNDLIDQADGPTLATLNEAPLFVSGLTLEQRDSIRPRLYEKVNPKGAALRNQLTKVMGKVEAASLAWIADRKALLEGTDRFTRPADPQPHARPGFARIG